MAQPVRSKTGRWCKARMRHEVRSKTGRWCKAGELERRCIVSEQMRRRNLDKLADAGTESGETRCGQTESESQGTSVSETTPPTVEPRQKLSRQCKHKKRIDPKCNDLAIAVASKTYRQPRPKPKRQLQKPKVQKQKPAPRPPSSSAPALQANQNGTVTGNTGTFLVDLRKGCNACGAALQLVNMVGNTVNRPLPGLPDDNIYIECSLCKCIAQVPTTKCKIVG